MNSKSSLFQGSDRVIGLPTLQFCQYIRETLSSEGVGHASSVDIGIQASDSGLPLFDFPGQAFQMPIEGQHFFSDVGRHSGASPPPCQCDEALKLGRIT